MKVYEIIFSPTGGTKKVSDILTNELSNEIQTIDLTDSNNSFHDVILSHDDIAVIAVPSYGGRVPEPATKRLAEIKGNNAKAIIMCVYGNRAYEDTLVELQDTAKQAGFKVISAIAAVAEHSIAHQYAAGRPDTEDKAQLSEFANKIKKKISSEVTSELLLSGNRPYKKSSSGGMIPKATKNCNQCGICADECPVQAIDKNNSMTADSKKCISCMRCVTVCPQSARQVNKVMLSTIGLALKKVCSERKDCELYI